MRYMLASLLALGFVAGVAPAQAPGRPAGPAPRKPTFSPYLNLLRQGNSTALNYYGIVRPEMNALNQFNSMQGQITDNRRAIADQSSALNPALPGTGEKTVAFLNLGGYFMNFSPAGTGGGASFNTMNPSGGSSGSQPAGTGRTRPLPGPTQRIGFR